MAITPSYKLLQNFVLETGFGHKTHMLAGTDREVRGIGPRGALELGQAKCARFGVARLRQGGHRPCGQRKSKNSVTMQGASSQTTIMLASIQNSQSLRS